MKKTLLLIGTVFMGLSSFAQNPGLVISEILGNPSGSNDSPFEWVELVATSNINFAATPYTVVVCNNTPGGTVNGWIEGSAITYAFQINTGSVNRGEVVYVGGSSMAPTGTKIRTINTGTTAGDGFGSAATAGVFGNGGGNGDGIAVFNLPVAALTNSTVPVDALFYGTGLGTAIVNGGTDGYQLPVSDLYSGGKLQASSFFAGDPGGDQTIRAVGSYNTQTAAWTTARTWTLVTPTLNNLSNLTLLPPPGTFTFSAVTQNFAENAGTVNIGINAASANSYPAKVILSYSVYTDATETADFTLAEDTITIPASFNGVQNVGLTIVDDAIAERTEKVILKMRALENANIGTNSFQIVYIKDNDYQAPTPNNELKLNLLTSFSNGGSGNSAEIVSFDPTTDKLYIANSIGAKLDIVDFSNPSAPVLLNSISIAPYGNLNSITVHNGVVAAAVENTIPQNNGSIVFFTENGTLISQVPVGAMPDMVTFNNDFTKVLAACEGEPNADYSVDPEGSVAIIDVAGGYASLSASNVTMVNFQSFNGQEVLLRSQGIRIFGPGASAAQDFEPEYITISEDNSTAYVALQENNAMAVIDIATATVTSVRTLGSMDYANGNNGLDASDQTAGVFIGSAPIKGLFMPDALAHASIAGTEYLFSANEGDAREYLGVYEEATRLSGATLDASIPDQNILKHNHFLGRINITKASGDTDGDGDIDDIHVFGTRSFSIWNAQTGALVFDSKDLIEQITANHPTLSGLFNASNVSTGPAVSKNRSDDKGPEPEGVATAIINGNQYLFVSLERVGGVMLFNVDVPTAPVFVGYYNNRNLVGIGPDLGAEGIITISKNDSPTGKDIVILANEVSSTLSIYEINTCVDLAGAAITVPTDSICAGDEVTLTIPGSAQSTVQWLKDDQIIAGETGNSLDVTEAGNYRVYVSNTTHACADTTLAETIEVLSLPAIAVGSDFAICIGDTVNLSAATAATISWNNSVQDGVDFFPTASMDYIATATDVYGCENSDTISVAVNLLPTVLAGVDQTVCRGTSITFSATGAPTLVWNNGITNGTPFNATTAGAYIVTGTDANGCIDKDTAVLTLYAVPNINLGSDMTLCANQFPVNLNGPGGYTTYSWSNGASTQNTTGAAAGSYILTVTNTNGCQDKDTVVITSTPCLGLDENPVFEYSMYPNPASTSVFVKTNAANSETVIYAANGQVLFTQKNTSTEFTVDLVDFADGMYWLKVSSEEGTATKQLLIKK